MAVENLYSAGTPAKVIMEAMLREVYGVAASIALDDDGVPSVSAIGSVHDV